MASFGSTMGIMTKFGNDGPHEGHRTEKRNSPAMHTFTAKIEIIGVNPFVFVPEEILSAIFEAAGKAKGPIPIHGTLNDSPYKQTLVKYSGAWRLYINTFMLKNSPNRIGETIHLTVEFDPSDRSLQPHPKLLLALEDNPEAKAKFESLPPSRKLEIVRYIGFLKTEDSVDRNVLKMLDFLLGKGRFVGRDTP
jgi:hypothetical protein